MKRAVTIGGVIAIIVALLFAFWPSGRERARGDAPTGSPQTETANTSSAASLRVTVEDVDGAPVAGATVRAGGESATTTKEGAATMALPPGDVAVAAQAAGYLGEGPYAAQHDVHLTVGATIELSLTLRRAGRIEGRVIAHGQGAPAKVAAHYVGSDEVGPSVETAADGRFVLDGVWPGRVRVAAEATDAATTFSREIALRDGQTVSDVTIDLGVAGSIAGTVHTVGGAPVATAQVFARGESSSLPRRADTTERGGFRIDNFPVGSARVRVQAPGFEEFLVDVDVVAGDVAVVDVTLTEGSGVWGRITTPTGAAPELANAFLMSGSDEEATVRADDAGDYRIDVEPAVGTHVLAVSPFFASSATSPASRGANVDLQLQPGGTITGSVRAAAGEPITQFEIGVESFEVEGPVPYGTHDIGTVEFVSGDGSYELGPLRPGRYWLRAAAKGHAPGSAGPFVVRGGATTAGADIELSGGGLVRGRVTNDKGEPVRRALVTIFDPFSAFATSRARTAADGTYTLRGVPSGRRSIRVAARGYLTNVASGLDVAAGAALTRDVVLQRAQKGEKFSFHGIGAVLQAEDGAVTVTKALEDRPAAIFGLKAGDRIMAVDGQSTADMRLGNVVELIRGEEGVAVQLEIEREGEGRFTVEVERGRVVVK